MSKRKGNYSAVGEVFAAYWHCYGGNRALLRSPYLHFAILLTAIVLPSWVSEPWWASVIAVLPNIVGFSIGGYAIWLGFGDEKFKALIAGKDFDDEVSPYMEVSATFCHFVVIQLAALIFALVATALNFDGSNMQFYMSIASMLGTDWQHIAAVLRWLGGSIGVFLFMYALTASLAAVFAIFGIARWFDLFRSKSDLTDLQIPRPTVPRDSNDPAQPTNNIDTASCPTGPSDHKAPGPG